MSGPTKRILASAAALAAVGVAAILALGAYWESLAEDDLQRVTREVEARGLPTGLDQLDEYLDRTYGPVPPAQNGAPALTEAMAAFGEIEDLTPELDESGRGYVEPDAVADYLEKHGHLVLPVQAALRDYSRFRFDSVWWSEDGPATPVGLGFSTISEVLAMRAHTKREAGDLAGALEEVGFLVSLGESLREVPRPLEQLVRLACLDRALTEMKELLAAAVAPRELASLIPGVDVRPAFSAALATEAAFYRTITRDVLEEADSAGWGLGLVPTRAAMKLDLARVLRLQLTAVDLVADLGPDTLDRMRSNEAAFLEEAGPLAKILMTSTSSMVEHVLEFEDERALVRFGTELLARRAELGSWPRGDELPERPTSAVDGAPLVLVEREAGLDLTLGSASWSLGDR